MIMMLDRNSPVEKPAAETISAVVRLFGSIPTVTFGQPPITVANLSNDHRQTFIRELSAQEHDHHVSRLLQEMRAASKAFVVIYPRRVVVASGRSGEAYQKFEAIYTRVSELQDAEHEQYREVDRLVRSLEEEA